jgi:hypothetical protein
MSGTKLREILKHINFAALSIPAAILTASAIFKLQPIIQQALIGILLVWFGREAMTGFELWR